MPINQNEKVFEEDIKAVSKGLVSHMYLYLQTMNIMESLNTESITDVHEKILQIAGLAGVDSFPKFRTCWSELKHPYFGDTESFNPSG